MCRNRQVRERLKRLRVTVSRALVTTHEQQSKLVKFVNGKKTHRSGSASLVMTQSLLHYQGATAPHNADAADRKLFQEMYLRPVTGLD